MKLQSFRDAVVLAVDLPADAIRARDSRCPPLDLDREQYEWRL